MSQVTDQSLKSDQACLVHKDEQQDYQTHYEDKHDQGAYPRLGYRRWSAAEPVDSGDLNRSDASVPEPEVSVTVG